ncbi:hypothetical protein Dda_6967 [Drechslerella dactyloides]|uniref:Uncharacterized protein n=1 Tax=Drechslerella dactyloides TaxID=74499 RepID=A0AAD6NH18_DREDA|nr:hypothetical protein Dda_6967 [Drechslerella dactyloides]
MSKRLASASTRYVKRRRVDGSPPLKKRAVSDWLTATQHPIYDHPVYGHCLINGLPMSQHDSLEFREFLQKLAEDEELRWWGREHAELSAAIGPVAADPERWAGGSSLTESFTLPLSEPKSSATRTRSRSNSPTKRGGVSRRPSRTQSRRLPPKILDNESNIVSVPSDATSQVTADTQYTSNITEQRGELIFCTPSIYMSHNNPIAGSIPGAVASFRRQLEPDSLIRGCLPHTIRLDLERDFSDTWIAEEWFSEKHRDNYQAILDQVGRLVNLSSQLLIDNAGESSWYQVAQLVLDGAQPAAPNKLLVSHLTHTNFAPSHYPVRAPRFKVDYIIEANNVFAGSRLFQIQKQPHKLTPEVIGGPWSLGGTNSFASALKLVLAVEEMRAHACGKWWDAVVEGVGATAAQL